MIKDPTIAAFNAAETQNYTLWFILGMLGHFVTLTWASLATPRVPMGVDEEAPTGHDDHESFAREFQAHAKAERLRYAWMGTRVGAPLQVLAAAFTIGSVIFESGVFDREHFLPSTPTEQPALTNTANASAGVPETLTDIPRTETEPKAVSIPVGEDHEADDPGDRAIAEVLAGYDCTPTANGGRVFNCTPRDEATAWVEPTGTWRGTYSRQGTPRDRSVEIKFGETTTVQYPDSACSGTLTPTGTTPRPGEGRQYRETLTTERGPCLNNGLVTLKPISDRTALEFEWLTSRGSRRRVWNGLLTQTEF